MSEIPSMSRQYKQSEPFQRKGNQWDWSWDDWDGIITRNFFFFGGPYRDIRIFKEAGIAILKDFFKKRKNTCNGHVRNLIREII